MDYLVRSLTLSCFFPPRSTHQACALAFSFKYVYHENYVALMFDNRGTQNRETPLRRIEGSHFEIRCVDGLSNPYLVLAVIIGAGLQGVLDKEPLAMKDCPNDPAILTSQARKELGITEQFPKSIGEALSSLEADEQLHHILSKSVVETYLTVKRAESEMLQEMEPTKRRSWLIERY